MNNEELTNALKVGVYHAKCAAQRAHILAMRNNAEGMHGIAADWEKMAAESEQAAEFISKALTKLLEGAHA